MATTNWERHYTADGDAIIVRQSWRNRAHWFAVIALVTVGLLYFTWQYPEHSTIPITIFGTELEFPFLWVVPLALACVFGHSIIDKKLVLTPDYLIKVEGAASWRERTVRLEYHRIQEIEIEHTLWQQAIGIGDIKVTPIVTGPDQGAMHLNGIRSPRILKDLLRDLIKKREQSAANGGQNGHRSNTANQSIGIDPDRLISNSDSRF